MAVGDPIGDLSDLLNLASGGQSGSPEIVTFLKKNTIGGTVTGSAGQGVIQSLWLYDGKPCGGTAPSTAAVCTNSTNGSLRQTTSASGAKKRLLSFFLTAKASVSGGTSAANQGGVIVYDRLCHQGGIAATGGTLSTNLPTAALTRRTTGLGVEAWIEIYSAIAGSPTTITASYTDDAGNSGNTSQAATFAGSSTSAQGTVIPLRLAASDRGVRAVASVTIGTVNGGGNFGVTLAYPLLTLPTILPGCTEIWNGILKASGPLDLGATSDACLAFTFQMSNNANVIPEFSGAAYFVEK